MFDICDIRPSCLPRSDVTLLKNAQRTKVSNKRHNNELWNFFLKDLIINLINKLLIYVPPSSSVDDSTLIACCKSVGFVRLIRNNI